MNIKNPELIKRLANFKPLFFVKPQVVSGGQFAVVQWSRGLLLEPNILRLLAKEFLPLIDWNKIDVIGGIELQGVPLATAIALETNKPMVMVREKPKRVGRSAIVGDTNFIFPGVRVLLVDDLMAYGGTKEQRTKILQEQGAMVTDSAVFLYVKCVPPTNGATEYDFCAEDWLQKHNIRSHALIDYVELGQLQFEANTISKETFEFIKENTNAPYWENAENLTRLYEFMKKEGLPIEDFVLQFMKEHGVKI
ncbi:MAG: phosphoribosyltransferase family protein [bacterium]|nr:phosphoribosyltransferase family protein [bacterium]